LIVTEYEINKSPKCTPFCKKIVQNCVVSGAPPQTPLWSLRCSLRPPSREGRLAFGNRSFLPSGACNFLDLDIPVLNIFLSSHGLKPNSAYAYTVYMYMTSWLH